MMREKRLRNKLLPLAGIAVIAVITGCGDKKAENQAPGEDADAHSAAQSSPAVADPGERQQQLASEAIDLIGRVAEAVVSITDLESAKSAAENIRLLDGEFQALAEMMEEAGKPTDGLAAKFRADHSRASEAMRTRIGNTMPDLNEQPEVIEIINKAFTEFGKTLEHPAFKDYGIDGN